MIKLHGRGAGADKFFRRIVMEKLKEKREMVNVFLGYKNRMTPPIINRKIEEEMKLIEDYLEIEFEYKVFQENQDCYALVIYTVGNKIEHLMNCYTEKAESIRALIADKLSVLALDCIQELIVDEIESKLGLYVVKEWYPGNQGFPIENQEFILKRMDSVCSISVNSYCQLFPMKSVALKLELGEKATGHVRCMDCDNPCELKIEATHD